MVTFSLVFNSIVWALIFVFIIYSMHEIIVTKKGKYPPFVPSVGEAKKTIIKEISKKLKRSKEKLTILDPGCGVGSIIIPLAKKFPNHNFVGIEWSFPYYFAKIRATGLKNVKLVHADMFKQSFSRADIVVCFMIDEITVPFVEKVIKDAKKEVLLYSIFLELPLLNRIKKIRYKHFGIIDAFIHVYKLDIEYRKKSP